MKPSALRNLGPRSDAMLEEVGIRSVEDLRVLGAVEAYRRLKFAFGKRVSMNALWAIHAGLQDRHWQSLTQEEKAWLRTEISAPTDK